jgi:hypothetical protein
LKPNRRSLHQTISSRVRKSRLLGSWESRSGLNVETTSHTSQHGLVPVLYKYFVPLRGKKQSHQNDVPPNPIGLAHQSRATRQAYCMVWFMPPTATIHNNTQNTQHTQKQTTHHLEPIWATCRTWSKQSLCVLACLSVKLCHYNMARYNNRPLHTYMPPSSCESLLFQ